MTTVSDTQKKIEKAATALAAALQEDPRWVAWEKAQNSIEEDAELSGALERFQELAQKVQQAQDGGDALSGEEVLEISALQKQIQENPRFVAHNEAGSDFVACLQESNEYLSAALGLDYASTAAHRTNFD